MAKYKPDPNYIATVPQLIEELRSFKELTMSNPAVSSPWPPYVEKPEHLDWTLEDLQKLYDERTVPNQETGGKLGRARKRAKTSFSQLARHAVLSLEGKGDLERWPGFDVGRNPGESRCREPYRASPPVVRVEDGD